MFILSLWHRQSRQLFLLVRHGFKDLPCASYSTSPKLNVWTVDIHLDLWKNMARTALIEIMQNSQRSYEENQIFQQFQHNGSYPLCITWHSYRQSIAVNVVVVRKVHRFSLAYRKIIVPVLPIIYYYIIFTNCFQQPVLIWS